MLRRLFIAVLIACLSLPALAVPAVAGAVATAGAHCHGAAPVAAQSDHAPAQKAPAVPAAHWCIGCIAGLPALAAPAAPLALPAVVPHRAGQVQLAGLSPGPAAPPPRA